MKGRCFAAPLAALLLAAVSPARAGDTPSDWRGAWIDSRLEVDVSGIPVTGFVDNAEKAAQDYPLAGPIAPWNAEGAARVEKMLAKVIAGLNKAVGWGYPMMMNSPAPFEFAIGPDKVVIFNLYRDVRVIYTDGRPHLPEDEAWPTTWGDSIGHWEGDTLVIDTVWVRNPTEFADFAPPLSEQAHYVERLRMTAPGTIDAEMTIEDPVTLSQPWVIHRTYKRVEGLDRVTLDGLVNDRTGLDNGVFTIEPEKVAP